MKLKVQQHGAVGIQRDGRVFHACTDKANREGRQVLLGCRQSANDVRYTPLKCPITCTAHLGR